VGFGYPLYNAAWALLVVLTPAYTTGGAHAAGPPLFGGVVAKMRSGYVSVGQWLVLALGKHQGDTKKGSKMKL